AGKPRRLKRKFSDFLLRYTRDITLAVVEAKSDRPAIIGRAEGYEVPYLDPAYRPTTVVPGTGQSVLGKGEQDIYVSRGHFMLRPAAGGLLLVKGAPRAGGGIRPPLNGTRLLAPVRRAMGPGEEYLIERGMAAVVHLPNGTRVRIDSR